MTKRKNESKQTKKPERYRFLQHPLHDAVEFYRAAPHSTDALCRINYLLHLAQRMIRIRHDSRKRCVHTNIDNEERNDSNPLTVQKACDGTFEASSPEQTDSPDLPFAFVQDDESTNLDCVNPKKKKRVRKQQNRNDTYFSPLSLSRHYIRTLKQIAEKHVIRLDSSVKRFLCKRCSIPWIPGSSCSIKLSKCKKQKYVLYRCLECGECKRYPTGLPKQKKDRSVNVKPCSGESKCKKKNPVTTTRVIDD